MPHIKHQINMKKGILFGVLSFAFTLMVQAQSIVSTEPQNKNVVLEEYTGIHCTYCPDGHRIAEGIAASHPGDVVLINVHQGSFASPGANEPDYRTPFGDALANQAGVNSYPSGTVNRHVFSGTKTAMSRGSWGGAADQILAQSSPVNIGIESNFDQASRLLTVTVELYYTAASATASNFINVALLQNNVIGPQTGGGMGNNYVHKHMLRHLITGQWGEEIYTTSQGTLVTKTYTYTVPAEYNSVPCVVENCDIAVFVTETHQEVINGDVVKAIGGSNRYIGKATVTNDFKLGNPTQSCDFACDVTGALPSGESYILDLVQLDTVPGWSHAIVIDGITYTASATVQLNQNDAKNITIAITPGNTAAVASYQLQMKSVSYPSAPIQVASVNVISGITTLVVNGSGGVESTNSQGAYTAGLDFAGCTTYDVIPASLLIKAVDNGVLVHVNSIFYNVAWTFPSFKDAESDALKAIMNSGRHVLVAGQDIGWDIMSGASGSNGNTNTRDLYTNYLCAKFLDDGSTANNQITAVTSDPIYGQAGNSTVIDAYAGNMYPDKIDTLNPARPIFLYKNNNASRAAIRVEKNNYKAVYFGLGFEMMSTIAVRNKIIKLTYDWFNELISGQEYEAALANIMDQNYPNPANETTLIPLYNIENGMKLVITNMKGQSELVLPLSKGDSKAVINTSALKSGRYICSIWNNSKLIGSKQIIVQH